MPGQTTKVQHKIDVQGQVPFKQRYYRVNPKVQQLQQEEVTRMLENGIVTRSRSDWASPVVMVRKKDGSIRFCVDYRKLNAITRKDSYPMPRIEDILESLDGARIFSTLDLASGYWQIPVSEEDKAKTAFITPFGLFEFNVMPFGLCNAPATFQRLMNEVLDDVIGKFCFVYIDDVIVYSKNFQEHLEHLQEIFTKLMKYSLHLKISKCSLFQHEIKFLGHVVNNQGIQVDPDKVKAIKDFPAPENVTAVQRFLGMAGYYRRFIRHFSLIASPLTALTRKDVKFRWTSVEKQAFEEIKKHLLQPPILTYPQLNMPFKVTTDASGIGLGAILSQEHEGHNKVIAYASRKLSAPEKNYSATERECLAVVWAVKLYRHYLTAQHFEVITDHNALKWLMGLKEPVGRLARWALALQEFDFHVTYRPGALHSDVDALSRAPVFAVTVTESSFASEQRKDPTIKPWFDLLEKGQLPADDKEARAMKLVQEYYIIQDNKLYHLSGQTRKYREPVQQRLVVPAPLRSEVLKECHDSVLSGHFGVARTFDQVRKRYFWTGMFKDVENWVKSCKLCASKKSSTQLAPGELQPIQVSKPWEIIGVDILGPLTETSLGNQYVLVFSDYLTKWVEAYPLKKADAISVARKLFEEIICRYGAPKRLLSDRGLVFRSNIVKELCQIFKAKKVFTSAYHPQTDGLVERFNKTLAQLLSMYTSRNQQDWDEYLPAVLFAYRSTRQESTKETPYFLMYGRDPDVPSDIVKGLRLSVNGPKNVIQWRDTLLETLKEAYNFVREELSSAQQKQKEAYNKKHRKKEYKIGDQVMMFDPKTPEGLTPKLVRKWQGPFKIQEVTGQQTYKLVDSEGNQFPSTVHVQRLKPFTTRQVDDQPQDEDEEEKNKVDETEQYEVEAICGKRIVDHKIEYLVKWKGYPDSENSWVQAKNMDAARLIKTYNRELKKQVPPPT